MKKNAFCGLIFALAISATISAEDGIASQAESEKSKTVESQKENEKKRVVLTVDQAVDQALASHVDILRSEISKNKSEREYKHSWNKVLPSISAGLEGSSSAATDSPADTTTTYGAGLTASLSIDLGLSSKIKALKAAYKAGQTSYEDTIRSTESAVRQTFYKLLNLKAQISTSQDTVDSYERTYNQTKAKFNRGQASELELLTAQVNYETAKPDLDTAHSNFVNALIEFLNDIGWELKEGEIVDLEGSLEIADSVSEIDGKILQNAVSNSATVKELELKIEEAKANKKSTWASDRLPTLKVTGSYYPWSKSYVKESDISTDTSSWSASVGISLPLSNWIYGSSASDEIAALDDTIKDYEIQLKDAKNTAFTEALEKLNDIRLAKQTLATRKMNVELAKKSYQMTEEAYNRGTKDLLELQTSLDKLHSAEVSLKEEQYTLICDVLDLEEKLGLDFGAFFNKESADTTNTETSSATAKAGV